MLIIQALIVQFRATTMVLVNERRTVETKLQYIALVVQAHSDMTYRSYRDIRYNTGLDGYIEE
jgi:hypothetical protein